MTPAVAPTILAADDDAVTRRALAHAIEACGWRPHVVASGEDALAELTKPNGPLVAILDWIMPGLSGVEVCERVRQVKREVQPYLIMGTVRDETREVIVGLDAGADDYMIKPIDPHELGARVRVGLRTIALQQMLCSRVADLQQALSHVKELRGLLPICAYCKRIRDDQNYWQTVEEYLLEHTDVSFSHAFCPVCIKTHIDPELASRAMDKRS
jgi:DNA-binding response OmpR family regulator